MSDKKNAVCPVCRAESIRTFPHTSFCPVCQKWQKFITTNTKGKKKKAVEEPEEKAMVEESDTDETRQAIDFLDACNEP